MKKKEQLIEKSDDSDSIYKYGPEDYGGLKEYYLIVDNEGIEKVFNLYLAEVIEPLDMLLCSSEKEIQSLKEDSPYRKELEEIVEDIQSKNYQIRTNYNDFLSWISYYKDILDEMYGTYRRKNLILDDCILSAGCNVQQCIERNLMEFSQQRQQLKHLINDIVTSIQQLKIKYNINN